MYVFRQSSEKQKLPFTGNDGGVFALRALRATFMMTFAY